MTEEEVKVAWKIMDLLGAEDTKLREKGDCTCCRAVRTRSTTIY